MFEKHIKIVKISFEEPLNKTPWKGRRKMPK